MSGIEGLRAHWGFTRTPFTKDLAPSMLHRHPGHAEAVARIAWCVEEGRHRCRHWRGRRRQDRRRPSRPRPISTAPATPSSTWATPPSAPAASTPPSSPSSARSPASTGCRFIPQATTPSPPRSPSEDAGSCSSSTKAHLLAADQLEELRLLTNADMDSTSPFCLVLVGQPTLRQRLRLGRLRRLRPARRVALRPAAAQPDRHRRIHRPPPQTGRPLRHPVLRRRHRPHPQSLPRTAPSGQQPGRPSPHRRLRRRAASIVDDKAARAAVTEVTAE